MARAASDSGYAVLTVSDILTVTGRRCQGCVRAWLKKYRGRLWRDYRIVRTPTGELHIHLWYMSLQRVCTVAGIADTGHHGIIAVDDLSLLTSHAIAIHTQGQQQRAHYAVSKARDCTLARPERYFDSQQAIPSAIRGPGVLFASRNRSVFFGAKAVTYGVSQPAIARDLNLSVQTVNRHLRQVLPSVRVFQHDPRGESVRFALQAVNSDSSTRYFRCRGRTFIQRPNLYYPAYVLKRQRYLRRKLRPSS